MLLGFWLFRSMLAQLSEGVKEVARIAQAVARPAAGRPMAAPPVMPTPARPVAGLGSIWELGEMARTMELLWRREARGHGGRHRRCCEPPERVSGSTGGAAVDHAGEPASPPCSIEGSALRSPAIRAAIQPPITEAKNAPPMLPTTLICGESSPTLGHPETP